MPIRSSPTPLPDTGADPLVRASEATRRHRVVDIVSLVLVAVVLVLVPIHRQSGVLFTYYREALVLAMCPLIPYYLYQRESRSLLSFPEFRILVVWIAYFFVCMLFDPGASIYGEDKEAASSMLSKVPAPFYVMRSFMLYVPMALLIGLRGLSFRDLFILMFCAMIISPYAIYLEYTSKEMESVDEMMYQSQLGHSPVAYNTFAPYLTFPFAAAIFITLCSRSTPIRVLALGVVVVNVTMIIYSQSRQSFLFSAALATSLLLFTRLNIRQIAAVGIVVTIAVVVISSSPVFSERYLSRESYDSQSDTGGQGRIEHAVAGIREIETGTDWIFGRGFSSVIFSGPHNNYIRVTQRTGLIGLVLTFGAFFLALVKMIQRRWRLRREGIYRMGVWWIVAVVLLFPLYHSLFGYPHETAWSSHVVWLGMGIYLAYQRSQLEHPQTEPPADRAAP